MTIETLKIAPPPPPAPQASVPTAPRLEIPAGEAEPVATPEADLRLEAAASKRAETEAYESRKRLELAERLVGANKSLVIEKDPGGEGFVYKSIDKKTGEVVRIWPREEVASKLSALADVDARGMMLNARA